MFLLTFYLLLLLNHQLLHSYYKYIVYLCNGFALTNM